MLLGEVFDADEQVLPEHSGASSSRLRHHFRVFGEDGCGSGASGDQGSLAAAQGHQAHRDLLH